MGPVNEQSQHPQPLADRSPEEVAAFLDDQQTAYEGLKARDLSST